MLDAKPLEDNLSVRNQIRPDELAQAASEGFRSVINNRPDGEEPGQPTSAEIEAAARAAGLEYRHIPMVPGQLSGELIGDFAQAARELPGPVLAFCRTGTRSTMLWSCANAGSKGVDGVLGAAAGAGYDLGQLRPTLESLAG